MAQIVTELCKIDLHIHSVASSTKTGDIAKVKDSTISNIGVLLKGIEIEKINMMSITDHNAFDYKLYRELKKKENNLKHLKKVLPGVEFDITIIDSNPAIHCVAIFDDSDDVNIKKIQQEITNHPFDKGDSYSLHEFRKLLSSIGLSVVLIAHQKGKVFHKSKRDLSSQGESVFKRVISAKYFDAVEFSNQLREQHLIDYKNKHELDDLTWVTGSDCHTWSVYPKAENVNNNIPAFTYIDSLPTFKGLVMAITDERRIHQQQYDVKKPILQKIDIEINGMQTEIPLSQGINAIIGDNNVGKSMLLHRITDSDSKNIYDNYLRRKNIVLKPHFSNNEEFLFDKQGDIANLFKDSKNRIQDIPIFKKSFKALNKEVASNYVKSFASKLLRRIEQNTSYESAKKSLNIDILIPIEDVQSTEIRMLRDLKYESKDYDSVIKSLKKIITEMNLLKKNKLFQEDLSKVIDSFDKLVDKYKLSNQMNNDNLEIVSRINSVTDAILKTDAKSNTSKAKKIAAFDTEISAALISLKEMIVNEHVELKDPYEDIKGGNLKASIVPFGKYKLVNRYVKSNLTIEEIKQMLNFPFDSRVVNVSDMEKLTLEKATSCLKKLDEGKSFEEKYWLHLSKVMEKRFETESVILEEDKDLIEGNSAGKNALIYLDVLSQDPQIKLYIVDQPGDDVSQNRIDIELNLILNQMRETKQIIMVTHKPQLVVNLDVDNVICIKCDDKGQITVVNGALEYEDELNDISILKTVVQELEGGLEVLEKRWKRYDK